MLEGDWKKRSADPKGGVHGYTPFFDRAMGEKVCACEPSARAPYERPRRKGRQDFGCEADKGESKNPFGNELL